MQQDTGRPGRRGAAIGLVLLVHAAVIGALLQVRVPRPRPAALERLVLMYLPLPAQPVAEDAPPVRAPPSATHRRLRSSSVAPGLSTSAVPDTLPSAGTSLPPIDWTAEQHQAAEVQGREIWQRLSQHCRDAFALHIFPPECHRYVAPEPWAPEEKRFGLAGPLPYVRLGPCVVGLGFWGCAVGKPPPPNGRVFDAMRDPDRPGATPDNGGYQAPPEPRERLH